MVTYVPYVGYLDPPEEVTDAEEERTLEVWDSPLDGVVGRGLHSYTIRLNVSAVCEMGGACRELLQGV